MMMQSMQSRVSSITGDDVTKRAQEKIEVLGEVEREVIEQCTYIQKQVNEVREKILAHLITPASVHGCLRGTVDDFIKPFEFKIEELSAKFETNREAWRREIQASE